MTPAPSSGTWKLLTRSTLATAPLVTSMMPSAFLGISSGRFFSFFALFCSTLLGSIVKTTKRLSAVMTGRASRPWAAINSPKLGIESSGGGAGCR